MQGGPVTVEVALLEAALDEDGQHNPREIEVLLDRALSERADLVYASPVNRAPHGFVRNAASKASKGNSTTSP